MFIDNDSKKHLTKGYIKSFCVPGIDEFVEIDGADYCVVCAKYVVNNSYEHGCFNRIDVYVEEIE